MAALTAIGGLVVAALIALGVRSLLAPKRRTRK